MKIYIFGFKNTITEKLIKSFDYKSSEKFYLRGIDNIRIFANIISKEKPDYILGFGEFSKKGNYFLLEEYCSNKFRGKIYGKKFEKLKIPGILKNNKDKKLKSSNTIGTSYCNFTCYIISKIIYDNNLQTRFDFLHIPKNFDFQDN